MATKTKTTKSTTRGAQTSNVLRDERGGKSSKSASASSLCAKALKTDGATGSEKGSKDIARANRLLIQAATAIRDSRSK